MKKLVPLLKDLRDLLQDRETWTKGALARNQDGRATTPRSEAACKWCLLGGIIKVTEVEPNVTQGNHSLGKSARAMMGALAKTLKCPNDPSYMENFNDGYLNGVPAEFAWRNAGMHSGVLKLIDRTIERETQ